MMIRLLSTTRSMVAFFQIAEQGERPFLAEIGLDCLNSLVVVVANGLELVIEICKSDIVVHRSLVDSDDLHFTSENHRLDESCPLFHPGFFKQQLEISVLFRSQFDTVAEYCRVGLRFSARALLVLLLLFSSIRIEIFCF